MKFKLNKVDALGRWHIHRTIGGNHEGTHTLPWKFRRIPLGKLRLLLIWVYCDFCKEFWYDLIPYNKK